MLCLESETGRGSRSLRWYKFLFLYVFMLFYFIIIFLFFMKIIFIFSCSGIFRDVPECSGMFRVPAFIDAQMWINILLVVEHLWSQNKKIWTIIYPILAVKTSQSLTYRNSWRQTLFTSYSNSNRSHMVVIKVFIATVELNNVIVIS